MSLHQQQGVMVPRKEKSNSPLFNTTADDTEDRAINNPDGNALILSDGKNATNGQLLRPLNNMAANKTTNGSSHNQLSAASNNNTFNRTIGSRQSSPTDDVNNIGMHQHQKVSVNENKLNSVSNLSNVQNIAVQNNVPKESSLISVTGAGTSENQQVPSGSAPTQQINIDTGTFPGQVNTYLK